MLEQLSKRVADRISGETAITIPWEMIMELIMQFIQQCFPQRAAFLASSKSPTMLQRVAANITIRRTLGISGRREVVAIQSAMFTTAAEATEPELTQCHAEACSVLGIDYDHDPAG